jgi:hypothetical protein
VVTLFSLAGSEISLLLQVVWLIWLCPRYKIATRCNIATHESVSPDLKRKEACFVARSFQVLYSVRCTVLCITRA